MLLAAAVVAGVIAISERQGARDAATVADARRLAAQALSEERIDQALRLATAGVALDDSVATRSSLLSTLLRRPAAIGVLSPTGKELPALALSPDGETLAASDVDGTVTLFDTDTYEVVGEHQAPATAYVIAFDPQGDSLAVAEDSSATGGTLEILDAATGRVRSSTSLAAGQGFPLGIVIYAPNGRSLFVPYIRGGSLFLRRYDARRGTPLGKPVRVGIPDIPLMTPDGRLLVSADRGVKALDAETLRVIRRYPVRGSPTAVSPDGRTLAIDHDDEGLELLDLASGRVRTLTGARGDVQAFSPDGRTLSTSEDDGSVILWDVEEGVRIETLEGHAGVTEMHAFSPDGRTLYTAGNDGRVIVWDVAGDRRLGRPFPMVRGLEPGHDYPPAFALSPDGRAVAVARLDGRVDLIDAETLRRTASFEAFPGGRQRRSITRPMDGGWRWRERVAASGSGTSSRKIGSARSFALPGALGRPTREPSRRSPSARAICSPRRRWGARCGSGTSAGASCFDRRCACLPPCMGWRSARTARSWRFRSVLTPTKVPTASRSSTSQAASGLRGFPPTARSSRLPSPPTATCSRVAWSTAARSSGRPTAGGGWDVRSLARPRPLSNWSSHRTGTRLRPHTRTTRWRSGTSPRRSRSGPPWASRWGEDSWVTARFTPDGARLFVLSDPGEGSASSLWRATRWEVDPELWLQRACAVAGGGLTPEQWEEAVPEQDYLSVCPSG